MVNGGIIEVNINKISEVLFYIILLRPPPTGGRFIKAKSQFENFLIKLLIEWFNLYKNYS